MRTTRKGTWCGCLTLQAELWAFTVHAGLGHWTLAPEGAWCRHTHTAIQTWLGGAQVHACLTLCPWKNTGNTLKQYRQHTKTIQATHWNTTGNTLKQYRQHIDWNNTGNTLKQYRQHTEIQLEATHWNTIRGNTLKQWWQPPQTIQTTLSNNTGNIQCRQHPQTIQTTPSNNTGNSMKQYRQLPQTIQAAPSKNTGTPQTIPATPSMMATAPDNTGNTLKQYRQYHQIIQATL